MCELQSLLDFEWGWNLCQEDLCLNGWFFKKQFGDFLRTPMNAVVPETREKNTYLHKMHLQFGVLELLNCMVRTLCVGGR